MSTRRALHFVLKVGSLKKNLEFFRDQLCMTVLRHEVFEKGCEATCNGPYDGKWSKTMIGYGPEDNHFVLELTYNYSIGSYLLGNDLQHIKVDVNKEKFTEIRNNLPAYQSSTDGILQVNSPDGYKFLITQKCDVAKNDVSEVCLATNDFEKSKAYWVDLLKMNLHGESSLDQDQLILSYARDQAKVKLQKIDNILDKKSAYGRIAFSCPSAELPIIEKIVEDAGQTVLTPFLSLDTPGKATVQVVILADPSGHEICFVGDEGFRELSQVDPAANCLIEKSIAEDKSEEWFEMKNKKKDTI